MGAELKKHREMCKYFLEEKDIKGIKLTFCNAVGKGRCTFGNPHNFLLCPNYIRYSKSVEEQTPKTATLPRFPS